MPRHANYVPHGVIPAVLLPFENDLSIDEASFRKHLRDVAAVEGLSAITINAHSTEVASCTFDEQRRVLDIAQDEIGGRLPLINGIWADGSLEAARLARMAAAGRRLGAPGVPAGAVHARAIAGHGARAFQAHRRRHRSAADRVPVPAGDGPRLSEGHAAEAVRRSADHPRHQGLDRQCAAPRMAHPHAAEPAAAGERAHHAQLVAVLVAGARLQRPAVRLRQRDRRSAGADVPRRAEQTTWRRPGASTTASSRPRACSTPIPSSTCTTA